YDFYNRKIEEYKKAAPQSLDREKYAQELMEEARQKADTRRVLMETLIDSKKKGEGVTTEEVAQIDKAVNGLIEFEKTHAHLDPLLEKIAKKEKPLEKADYEAVIAILTPHDIIKDDAVSQSAFESTAAGILVGAMTPEQRVELIKVFMYGERRSETPALMDTFLGMDLISDAQARELLKGTPFEEEIVKKIESGQYRAQRKALAQQRDKDAEHYRGIYNENVVGRFMGKPLLGLVAMVWGGATMFVNFLMARQKGEKFTTIKALGRSLKNPRFLLGAGVAAGGLEVTGTGMKLREGWFGGGAVSRGIERIGKWAEGEEKGKTLEEKAKNVITEIKENGAPPLKSYLEKGGYMALTTLRAEIIAERAQHKKPRNIELAELIKTEKDSDQKARLQDMLALPQASRDIINDDLGMVAEAGSILKLKSNEEFLAQYNAKPDTNNPPPKHATI
ncbi:hypothetical protein KKH03_01690, partial [Patescibacteria group bacterium]|nr:hypothetical protein [Patescibacteria group bacterium]